jgi:hypothetical protein
MSTTIPGPGIRVDPEREDALGRLRRRRKAGEDFVVFVGVNALLWVIWLVADRSTDGSIPWPAWVSIAWGFFLAIDLWKAYAPWPRSLRRPIGEPEIEREIERLRSERKEQS